jgi:hypothetical protein
MALNSAVKIPSLAIVVSKPGSERRYGAAIVVSALMSLAGMAVVVAAPASGDSQSAAAIFPPWWSPAAAFAAAGSVGEVARTGAVSSILIVHSSAPDLADRLRKAGALLVLDPIRLSQCERPVSEGYSRE